MEPLILMLLVAPLAVSPLTCHCNDRISCPSSTCHTDGVCRTSVQRIRNGGGVRLRYQCLSKDKLIPSGRPFECENSIKLLDRYVRQCCNTGDYCNQNISLSLQPTPGETTIGTPPFHSPNS